MATGKTGASNVFILKLMPAEEKREARLLFSVNPLHHETGISGTTFRKQV